MTDTDDPDRQAAAIRYRAWSTVHDRRAHRRYCDELDAELDQGQEPAPVVEVTYPMVGFAEPGILHDEISDRYYRYR